MGHKPDRGYLQSDVLQPLSGYADGDSYSYFNDLYY